MFGGSPHIGSKDQAGMPVVKAQVKIIGKRPLLWHHFGPDALPLEKKARTGVAGNNPDEWRTTVLATQDHQLYLEPSYFFGCFRNGAKYPRRGKGSLQSAVASTLQVTDHRVLIDRWLPKKGLENLKESDGHSVYLDV